MYEQIQYQPFSMPVGTPDDWVEPSYVEAWFGQQFYADPPIYPPDGDWFGDRHQFMFFTMQLSTPTFGPDGDGTFQGPATFDILEGAADFELRTPE